MFNWEAHVHSFFIHCPQVAPAFETIVNSFKIEDDFDVFDKENNHKFKVDQEIVDEDKCAEKFVS